MVQVERSAAKRRASSDGGSDKQTRDTIGTTSKDEGESEELKREERNRETGFGGGEARAEMEVRSDRLVQLAMEVLQGPM